MNNEEKLKILNHKNLIELNLKKEILGNPKRNINPKIFLESSLFKNVGDLIMEDAENYELDFDYYIQRIDSSIAAFNYVRFVDYFFEDFKRYLSNEELRKLLNALFKENHGIDFDERNMELFNKYLNDLIKNIMKIYKEME